MYELFEDPLKNNEGRLIFPEIAYLRTIVDSEIAKVKKYYRSIPHYLPPQNQIVKLLMSVAVPFEDDFYSYSRQVAAITTKLAMSMRLTAEGSEGRFLTSAGLYGLNSKEIVILTTTPFSLTDIEDTWKDITPIRILRHDYDNVNFAVPDGLRQSYIGSAVYEINLPLLACQYIAFRLDEKKNNSDKPKSIQQFVRMYPMTNTLESHFDLAVVNRFKNMIMDIKPLPYAKAHPFSIIDIRSKLDTALFKYAQYLKTAPREYRRMLALLPSLTESTVPGILTPPRLPASRQTSWALNYAVLPYVAMIVKMNKISGSKKDSYFNYHLKQGIRQIRADKQQYVGLGRAESKMVDYYLYNVIEPYL